PRHEGNSRHAVIVPYRLGVLLDRQDQAHRDMLDAIRLGIAEWRASGALDREIDLIVREVKDAVDGSALDLADEWRALFEHEPILGMIGPFGDMSGAAVRPLVEQGRLTTVTTSADDRFTGHYCFQLTVDHPVDIAHLLLRHARAQGCERPFLVREAGPCGARVEAAYRQAARQDGWTHVDVVERDDHFDARLARGGALGWDALLYYGGAAHAAVDAALRAAGLDPMRLTGTEIDRAHPVHGDAAALEGWIGLAVVHPGNRRFQAFRRAFSDQYGRDGGHARAAQGYDIGRMIGRVLVDIRPPSSEGLRDGLDRIRMMPVATGAPGTVASFTRYDRRALKNNPLALAIVRDGAAMPLARPASASA
ncbi:substrate-binding protein, partial [Sphingobium faniae]